MIVLVESGFDHVKPVVLLQFAGVCTTLLSQPVEPSEKIGKFWHNDLMALSDGVRNRAKIMFHPPACSIFHGVYWLPPACK